MTHRREQYLNNRLEQDHRGIKQHYHRMLGFGSFASASRFCLAFDALRQYFRRRQHCGEKVSLSAQREQFAERWRVLVAEMAARSPVGLARSSILGASGRDTHHKSS